MFENLNQKDQRAIKLGAVGIAVIVILLFFLEINQRWTKAQESYDTINTKLLQNIPVAKKEIFNTFSSVL